MEDQFFLTYFRNILFCLEIPLNGRRLFPCVKTEGQTDGHTDMTKLIVAFRNFSKVPNEEE